MVKTWFLVFTVFLLVMVSFVWAKEELPIEKDSPPSETEIICFAALEKWVCAPASDQQQAKDKAMRLIEEKSQQGAVIINTIPEEQQWQQVVVEEPVQDQPQSAAITSSTSVSNAVTMKTQSTSAVNHDLPNGVTEESLSGVESTMDPSNSSIQSQSFSDWQSNHANQWTLQAVGTTNLPNLEQFIIQNQLGRETMAVATTEVKEAPWHIVLVGLFDNRDQAVAFKADAENQGASWAINAWPRPINGIETID